MSPETLIASLDRALAAAGETIILRRGVSAPFTDLTVPASVRRFRAEELTGGIMQGDVKVILSPTGLDAAAWLAAGGSAGSAPFAADLRIPKIGDKVIAQGRSHRIENAMSFLVAGALVRIELQARG